ncbi:ThiF family adenylyltransferase [Pedobacter lusitanus]|uniref:ThiF family adenylyltransferase n=1 Tax=Pedobacter lusitanus TaxID=1503925 RepID=UPI0006969298|nr:ThiF family adenylyltransferase [Pedobacter lusitanus]
MDKINSSINAPDYSTIYRPVYFRLINPEEEESLKALIKSNPALTIYDTILSQLAELIKLNNPQKKLSPEESAELISKHAGTDTDKYGVWVYFPWSNKLVHTLDEQEFAQVRTSRNIYKVTPEEIAVLQQKKIGIIGLSVGQSIALTLAMERTCGELRLADFDEIELSNMNRIKVNIQDLGLNKAVVAARQIAELDPFINVICFTDGISLDNIADFFTSNGKLDILVEECDGIDIKILARIKAKALGIPVVMDTNDKGMLDVERFDLEPERPIFHGKVAELEALTPDQLTEKLNKLTIPEKIGYLAKIIGYENLSEAMMKSVNEMNKTIVGWPQLASAVTLGGAMITDISRRILLKQFSTSGRYFVDFDNLFQDEFNTITHLNGDNDTH